MTPEQERYFKRQDRSMRKYHSKKNIARRRAEREAYARAQDDPNAPRDNALFLTVVFGIFAILIVLAFSFPV